MISLGQMVRDAITGFAGVATIKVERLHGSTCFVVESKELHEGKPIEATFEENRLHVVKEAAEAVREAA
jgi:hypothetical protein